MLLKRYWKWIISWLILIAVAIISISFYWEQSKQEITNSQNMIGQKMYKFPDENQKHEGTWITWPHRYTYGRSYAKSIEYIWVDMVQALTSGENVHIIAYDRNLKEHIQDILEQKNIDMKKVDFIIAKSDDVWTRDTGPIFVYSNKGELTIADFGFDGWGKKAPYKKDDDIAKAVGQEKNFPIIDISSFILEGGSVEVAEDGTVMATKSSVISKNRNSKLNQKEAEKYLKQFLGATNFIWLDGVIDEDITDAHIDGFARFYDKNTILTVPENDFFNLYDKIKESDYLTLHQARNASGTPYQIKEIPLTANNVKGLKYKGSYLNFYLGNKVLLLPIYGDSNDQIVIQEMSKLYPDKKIVPINVVPLYKNGGMIHCVTQQQPYNIKK